MEEFKSSMRSLAKRIHSLKNTVTTEEATKMSLILPFFQTLGYDVFNPQEFLPEFTADIGIKKGEKVDYAIMQSNEPIILIETKPVGIKLGKYASQLYRYFSVTKARFAILTNGIEYWFFSDIDEQNKMDSKPFFKVNFDNLKDNQIIELSKFQKKNFDLDNILNTASELKYTNEIINLLTNEFENPGEEFISFIVSNIYDGRKTQTILDKFNGIVKSSLNQFISDALNDKLQTAIKNTSPQEEIRKTAEKEVLKINSPNRSDEKENNKRIVTTDEEIGGYNTIRMILNGTVTPSRVFYRDNASYFNILLDDNIRKWICRLYLDGTTKYIQFNDEEKLKIPIENTSNIHSFKDKLIETTKKFT